MSLEKYLDALKKEITFSDIVYERQRIDEAGTAHPLPGHDYHKKTDAELHFIAKDAKEAEDAMSGHNPKAANKYADQKNDAVTILHFRKKGMPDWYKKKYGHIKEETEIDEAAKDLPTWKLRSLVKNEIGGKENAEELARRQKEKKAGTYKSHSSDDAQAGVKDAKNFREETEIVEDNSALDAMDAKEKRKDKIRKFIKNQSPVKAKHTPGKQTVQKEEIELDEALKGGEKAAYDMGFAHGRKNSPKIDAYKSFGVYDKHYHDGYHAGKSSAETEDWHEEQKSKRFRREEVELEESEKNKRINQALADTERYIEKESKRDPKLRPKEVQDRLDFYVKHREKLKSMIENVENIDELSNELLDRYKKAAGESAREADKKGDFKKGNKRFSGIIKATKKQFDNDEKHSVKEDVGLDEDYDHEKVMKDHKDLSNRTLEQLHAAHSRVKSITRAMPDGMKSATLKHISKEIQKRRDAGERTKGYVITTHPDGTRSHRYID